MRRRTQPGWDSGFDEDEDEDVEEYGSADEDAEMAVIQQEFDFSHELAVAEVKASAEVNAVFKESELEKRAQCHVSIEKNPPANLQDTVGSGGGEAAIKDGQE